MTSICYGLANRLVRKGGHSNYWIGLSKAEDNCGNSDDYVDVTCRRRNWTWVDGTPYTVQDWVGTGPRRAYGLGKIYREGWYSADWDEDQYIFCERKGNYC